jgi:ketosteroid isomerase-like protein
MRRLHYAHKIRGMQMYVEPLTIVNDMYRARAAGDRIKMMALCSEQMTFSFNADPDKIGHGTTFIGWQAIHEHFARIRQHWDELDSEILKISADRDTPGQINAQVRFTLRHRASGEVFDGVKRQEWIVRDSIITRMTEYFDTNMLHAFQRFAETHTPPPPDPYTPQTRTDA